MNKIYSDGFLIGKNPSDVGGGYSIVAQDGTLIERKSIEQPGLTNNEAELLGVARAIELADRRADVCTDSAVARRWIHKGWSEARPDLHEKIQAAGCEAKSKGIRIVFVPRKKNLAGLYNERFRAGE